jgi:hypothetical protein
MMSNAASAQGTLTPDAFLPDPQKIESMIRNCVYNSVFYSRALSSASAEVAGYSAIVAVGYRLRIPRPVRGRCRLHHLRAGSVQPAAQGLVRNVDRSSDWEQSGIKWLEIAGTSVEQASSASWTLSDVRCFVRHSCHGVTNSPTRPAEPVTWAGGGPNRSANSSRVRPGGSSPTSKSVAIRTNV